MATAWPTNTPDSSPVGSINTGYYATGKATYFKWGTDASVQSLGATDVSGIAVINRITQKRKKDDLEFTNGAGVQSGRVQIFHGMIWDASIRDDSQLPLPVEGTYGTIVDMAGLLGAAGASYSAYVLTSDYDASMKSPGERTLVFERIKLIEG